MSVLISSMFVNKGSFIPEIKSFQNNLYLQTAYTFLRLKSEKDVLLKKIPPIITCVRLDFIFTYHFEKGPIIIAVLNLNKKIILRILNYKTPQKHYKIIKKVN